MAEWSEQASQWHEMYCHDLEVMSSNGEFERLSNYFSSDDKLHFSPLDINWDKYKQRTLD